MQIHVETRQSEMADLAPPRHQVGWDIPLHFDTNPESLRPFVPEIWPNNVFLTFRRPTTLTFDLKFWKYLSVTVYPIRTMYAKFHNDRLRNGLRYYTLKFCENTDKQTHTQTHKQTDRQTWALQYLALPLWGRGNNSLKCWSILKSAIGKQNLKIIFPSFFYY